MTPNGTLLAHNSVERISASSLRRKIASVAIQWQEHDAERLTIEEVSLPKTEQLRDELRTLTIEGLNCNTIVTRVQRQLLLVLEGGVPPRRVGFECKIVAEGPDDQQYPADGDSSYNLQAMKLDGTSSRASSVISNAALTVLRLQRRKLEAMANALADTFEQTGFQLPLSDTVKFF